MTNCFGNDPLVTIAMPVRNCATTIDDAIHSIITQTYANWKLLIIDDCSDDGTADIAAGYSDCRIQVVRGVQHRGLPYRLNQAITMTNGPLLARMDGDDISYPERLEKQVNLLRSKPEVDVVAAGILNVRSTGEIVGRQKFRGSEHEKIVASPWSGFHFNHGTWVGYTRWFERYMYDPSANRAEDNDILLRSYKDSRFFMLPEILYAYRVDHLSLAKILPARITICKSLWREFKNGDRKLLVGLPLQLIKAVVDIVAIGSGLTYRILRHRAAAVQSADVRGWEILKSGLTLAR